MKKYNISVLVTQFGTDHGKFKYDISGNKWNRYYPVKCLHSLGADPSDLHKVVEFRKKKLRFPPDRSCMPSLLVKRISALIPVVHHSRWSIKTFAGAVTAKSFSFLIDSKYDGIIYRKYIWFTCSKCKENKFLKCTNTYYGKWGRQPFIVKIPATTLIITTMTGVTTITTTSTVTNKSSTNDCEFEKKKKKNMCQKKAGSIIYYIFSMINDDGMSPRLPRSQQQTSKSILLSTRSPPNGLSTNFKIILTIG